MKIGLLNTLLQNISISTTLEKSDKKITCKTEGNPAKDETLSIGWETVRNGTAELHFTFDKSCFVDRAIIQLGEETFLTKLSLNDDKNRLSSYCAETGKTITEKEVVLEANSFTDKLTIGLQSDFSDIEVLSVKFYGALEDEKDIFPTPDNVSFKGKTVAASNFDSYCTDSALAENASNVLSEKFSEITGIALSEKDNGKIRFITDSSIKKDAYRLSVCEDTAEIYASNCRGFVMGAETFIKLCDEKCVHTAEINDSPAYPFRGVHIMLPSVQSMDFAKRLIKYMISPLGYNAVIIEVAGALEFTSHPEINEAVRNANAMYLAGKWPILPHGSVADRTTVPKESAAEFVEYIRSFGIEVIPEIQSLGHVQFMTLAHPDIAEVDPEAEKRLVDTRSEDARPSDFYKHSFCPSNPKSYEILFDLIDDIIEVFKPTEYVHMGHDEVYQFGVCPVCKTKDPAKLFYDDIMKIYNYLASKGLKMMIWSDMIQPVSAYATRPAIKLLPKDIIMMDFIWYFHLDEDIEENLLNENYKVIIGNLYSSHYPRFETRVRKKGMLGGQISAWVSTNETALQKEGKLYDFVMTSQMLWADSYSHLYTLCYDRMISAMMPQLRQKLGNKIYPSLAEGSKTELIVQNSTCFPPVGNQEQTTDIAVDGNYKSLIFSHTELKMLTHLPWSAHDITGKYILTFADGSIEEIPVTNDGIIGYWNRRHNEPLKHPLYRHTGYICTYFTDGTESKTADGENITIYKYEHILPEGKKLTRVQLIQSEDFDTEIFLCKLEGVK